MITGELKSRVDKVWNTMWSGGISNPLSVIEQLTYLLFIKGLDELHTRKEHQAARTGRPIEAPVFAAGEDALRWSRFRELAPEPLFETVRDRVFPRSMVGMDRAAAQAVFSEFLSNRSLTTPQIRFIEMVIEQLTARGVMEPCALYEAPFSRVHAGGPDALFAGKSNVIDGIFEKLKALDPEPLADAG